MIACASNPKITTKTGDINNLFGSYAFDKAIYVNPLSSAAYFGVKEYYTFNEDSFYLINAYGKEELKVTYEKAEVNEEEFAGSFQIDINVPDISSYKTKYQYTLKSHNTGSYYRIYEMDDELWLAKVNKGTGEEDKELIWSIFKLSKISEDVPYKVKMNGTSDDIQEFEELLGEENHTFVKTGDTCFNITTKSLENNSDYKVFKYNKSGASYLLFENNIYPLGMYFGALGVTSMEIADLNQDGAEELYFTNSWGSGLHRSNVGYFDPVLKEVITFEYSYETDELFLHKSEDGRLFLYAAEFDELTDFAHFSIKRIAYVSEIIYAGNQISLDFQVRE